MVATRLEGRAQTRSDTGYVEVPCSGQDTARCLTISPEAAFKPYSSATAATRKAGSRLPDSASLSSEQYAGIRQPQVTHLLPTIPRESAVEQSSHHEMKVRIQMPAFNPRIEGQQHRPSSARLRVHVVLRVSRNDRQMALLNVYIQSVWTIAHGCMHDQYFDPRVLIETRRKR